MTRGRVTIYDRQTVLDLEGPPALGDRYVVVRGNGPREGERMGVAIVVGFDDDGPLVDVQLGVDLDDDEDGA